MHRTFVGLRIGWDFVNDFFPNTARRGIAVDEDGVVNSVNTVNTQATSTHDYS